MLDSIYHMKIKLFSNHVLGLKPVVKKKIKNSSQSRILSLFCNSFNEFNNSKALM